ncbi:MAG: hypothetical protein GY805_05625 [Chloroflexi bacterium]|nr:hypothetical protein [Chloroflexota bacterium]
MKNEPENPSRIAEIGGILLQLGGWASMLLSIVFYLFFWRVDNEPGAKELPVLLWTAVSLCSLGGLAFLGGNILLIIKRAWLPLGIGWALCIALLIGAITLAPILLLFMV